MLWIKTMIITAHKVTELKTVIITAQEEKNTRLLTPEQIRAKHILDPRQFLLTNVRRTYLGSWSFTRSSAAHLRRFPGHAAGIIILLWLTCFEHAERDGSHEYDHIYKENRKRRMWSVHSLPLTPFGLRQFSHSHFELHPCESFRTRTMSSF